MGLGLSIVILVMIIRLCLVPLFVKQVNAQRKMAQHAPQLQELRKKYKNDKQRLNEETMKFYKENGVNPLAGCLPMIPQMIVFFALFSVLRAIADWTPGHTPQYGFTVPVVESAKQAKIFDKTIWIFGGPRVDHKTALELGFDAGFGPGTKPSDVANYIYYRLLERQGRAPPPQPTAHGTPDATIQGAEKP